MRLVTKIYPFIHKTYTLCVLYVLRGEFLQWTHVFKYVQWSKNFLLSTINFVLFALRLDFTVGSSIE